MVIFVKAAFEIQEIYKLLLITSNRTLYGLGGYIFYCIFIYDEGLFDTNLNWILDCPDGP